MNLDPLHRVIRSGSALWRSRRERHGRGGWLLMIGLAAVAIAGSIFLATAESPWDRRIPEKIGGGEVLTIRDTIVAGFWLGAAINVGLAALLLILARWWARPVSPTDPAASVAARPGGVPLAGRWFWVLTLLAVLVAGWIRAPRLSHSLWNDEEQAFRKFTWGEYQPESPGSDALKFKPAGWDRALFYSVNGNNHVVHTVAAKFCHQVWRFFARPEPETFRESVIRLEPFVSGLLVIVALAAWLRRAGFPLAGVTGAWLMAIHPWVLRYAAEARGYSAMLLFILLALFCVREALISRRWRWWLAYGLCQSLYLLCFAGAVYLAVSMNVLIAFLLIRNRDGSGLWRWLVACVLGAMLFLQVMTATVLRIWSWIQAPTVDPFPMDAGYFRDFWAHLAIGSPWAGADPSLHFGTDIAQLSEASPVWSLAFRVFLPVLLVLGMALGAKRCRPAGFLFATLAGAAVLIVVHNRVSELAFYGWYALYFAIGFVVALAFVAESLFAPGDGSSRGTARQVTPWVKAAAVFGFFVSLDHEPISRIRTHDRHPMRQAVIAARGEAPAIDARHAAVLSAAVGSGANQIRTYDPRVLWIKSVADLEAVEAEARAAGKPLVIYACGLLGLRQSQPEVAARLEDPSHFERGESLPGMEEFWSFQIFRSRAGAGPAR